MTSLYCNRIIWQMKGPDSDVIDITPQVATISPCDTASVTFRFSPKKEKNYSFKAIALTTFKDLNIEKSAHRYKYAVKLYGEGATGAIKVIEFRKQFY